ncbi:Retrovirus-related Pol polyprotein from transposon TNT 1-94 [Rhizoctonia solani]|uniref:Retrovirus-related Pol polyprotein from transposon TNT 1-94 n=1 Tax=Rhizoctonia solani TaxID=456999 RepID=A0A8H8NQD5_9AGAM|nr:Retrovirus-related Pol polyprotein from transposon TNT 1-94 [Rhizoctonia solani]QRW17545.1 Retrovirus-related Pol polyprotein from transposon TNT 1-94 [Rhizoctonia solani]
MVKKGAVKGMDIIGNCLPPESKCGPCMRGKQTRALFTKSQNHASKILKLLHITIDDKSQMIFVHILKGKSKFALRFKEVKISLKNLIGKKIKKLCTDGGGKFQSKVFKEWLKSNRIQHQAWARVPDNKETKLQAQSIECQYLGFAPNQKAHVLIEQANGQIITSQDIVFDKGDKPCQQIIIKDFDELDWNAKQVGNVEKQLKSEVKEIGISVSKQEDKAIEHKPLEPKFETPATLPPQSQAPSPKACETTPAPPVQPCCSTQATCLLEQYGARTNKHAKYAYTSVTNKPPKSFKEAMERPDFHLWLAVMIKEIDLITKHGVWKQAACPTDKNVVEFASQNLKLLQLNIKTAFLHGNLDEEIYMEQPEGFCNNDRSVWRLVKALYGLKQAAQAFYLRLRKVLVSIGFTRCKTNHAVFWQREGDKLAIILAHVDDMLLAGTPKLYLKDIKVDLAKSFDIVDLGEAQMFVRVKITRDCKLGTLKISQRQYIDNILKQFGMEEYKSCITPMAESLNLPKLNLPSINWTLYQQGVGSLMYAMISTWPNIAYATGLLAQHAANPGKEHWSALLQVLQYLQGTKDLGIVYNRLKKMELTGFVDTDYAGDPHTS